MEFGVFCTKGGLFMRWNFRFASLSLAAAFLGLFFGGALAQSYPNKPIRFVVATGPGGGADIVIDD
jgi:tripartite-type tricarboxylate transporter receptor subunit TctC